MNTEQIHSLLELSNKYYRSRVLDQAAGSAQEALDLSNKAAYQQGIVQSSLLLALIHSTYAKYRSDAAQTEQALQHLEKVRHLTAPHSNSNGIHTDLLLAFGQAYECKAAYSQATDYYQQALELSRKHQKGQGVITALCGLSRLKSAQHQFSEAYDLARQAQEYLESNELTNNQPLLAETYNQLIHVLVKRQEYGKILQYADRLLEVSRELGDVEKELQALRSLAIYYGVENNFKAAMNYSLEALEISKQIGYRNITAHCHINVGTIYANLFNYNDALHRYENVLSHFKGDLSDNTLLILYNNTAYIYYTTHKFELAKSYFEKALELAEDRQHKPMIAHSLALLSQTEAALGLFDQALEKANQAQAYFGQLGDVKGKHVNLINLGNIYFHRKAFDKAIKLTSQGIVTAKRMRDFIYEIKGYQILAQIYNKLQDFEKAFQYQMAYSTATENYASLQRARQVIDREIKYDIKEKQSRIEQLMRENEYQARLLAQNDQIASQNSQLRQVNEELRQFAYVVSHDLKEPLRMIGSYTQLIQREHSKSFGNSEQYFAYVSEGVSRMNKLLDALLQYATIGKSEEETEKVSLKDVVDIAVINLRIRIEETAAQIHCEDLPSVKGNQSLLIQLFQNLISNAIKFRKAEVDPIISIRSKTEGEEVMVSIEDNGIGIAQEFQDRIFIIFQRLHNRTQYEGTGIGLAICQKIVQRHNGRIWVESVEGEGATFFVAFPAGQE